MPCFLHKYRFSLLFLLSLLIFAKLSNGKTKGKEKHNKTEISIPMEDGTLLATDVYLPDIKTPVPTILIRTPYNKDAAEKAAEKFLKHNIAVVAQDCRGRYKSGGEFYPFMNERRDGIITLRWIRNQPWCNGKVGGWGGSYVGYTQWAISDSLEVLSPHLTGANMYDLLYPNSLFSLQTAFNWGLLVSAEKVTEDLLKDILKSYYILPLSSADDSTICDIKYINDWIDHNTYDEYWLTMDHSGITRAPLISVAGWYDIFLKQQIQDFQTLLSKGNPESRLIIGPWCHGSQGIKNEYGGKESTGNQGEIIANYLISHLKDSSFEIIQKPFTDKKYNLFIMERNEYFGSDTWPPKESESTSFYLGENNYLSENACHKKLKLQYTYNPEDPYKSLGGTALGAMVGPALQNNNADRNDQLAFESEILKEPLTLLGDLSAVLYISSDAESTDFIVCVQDVFPDGNIINIQEGGTRVRFSSEDEIIKEEIPVWATGYELKEGHKLRVVITSSWFPRFNRSLNTCTPAFTAWKTRIANQTLYIGDDYPSHIVLPVLKD